jgi:hypothetical protein
VIAAIPTSLFDGVGIAAMLVGSTNEAKKITLFHENSPVNHSINAAKQKAALSVVSRETQDHKNE